MWVAMRVAVVCRVTRAGRLLDVEFGEDDIYAYDDGGRFCRSQNCLGSSAESIWRRKSIMSGRPGDL